MRARLAVFLLVIIGLSSIATPVNLRSLKVPSDNEVLVVLDRARCILDALPQDADVFGFMPSPESTNQQFFEAEREERRLLLVRYTMAPRLVTRAVEQDWLIAYYSDHETGLAKVSGGAWRVVKDCQNGVFLLNR